LIRLNILNENQVAFAHEFVKTGDSGSAYRKVYGKTNIFITHFKVKALMKNQDLVKLIEELQAQKSLYYQYQLYNGLLNLGKVATVLITTSNYLVFRQPEIWQSILEFIR